MRLSLEVGDVAYERPPILDVQGRMPAIWLDGVRQADVVTADTDLGIVRRLQRDSNGNFFCHGDEVAIEEVTGAVTITWETRSDQ